MYAVSINLKTVTARFEPSWAFFKPLVFINDIPHLPIMNRFFNLKTIRTSGQI